jgi:hypothetical protein
MLHESGPILRTYFSLTLGLPYCVRLSCLGLRPLPVATCLRIFMVWFVAVGAGTPVPTYASWIREAHSKGYINTCTEKIAQQGHPAPASMPLRLTVTRDPLRNEQEFSKVYGGCEPPTPSAIGRVDGSR